MKTRRFLWVFFLVLGFIVLCSMLSFGQANQAEVPGDDFSLEGALEVFKKSASPEDFERQLNSADSKVNNLDLNGDGDIDYIRVIDRKEGNVHAFILQAVISETESQDVAVIELEKQADGKAVLQITGDEDVYGMETIIEPTSEVRVNAGTSTARTVVNVWAWPSVQYVYSPYYAGWVSPYRWSVRPIWWHPWRPVAYYTYNPWWQPYRNYYSISYRHRIGYAHQLYRPMRTTSVYVYNRHHDQIAQYRSRQNNTVHYGERNERGRDSQRPGSYDRRDNNNAGRPSSAQQGNSREGANTKQPDWRNSSGRNLNQNQNQNLNQNLNQNQNKETIMPRTYSVDRTNGAREQRLNREPLPGQNQSRPANDFQRAPDNTNRMNRTATPSVNHEPTIQHGQTRMPSRQVSRPAPSNNPGKTLPSNKAGSERKSTGRGR